MDLNNISISADDCENAASITSTISESYRGEDQDYPEMLETSCCESKDEHTQCNRYQETYCSLESDIDDSDLDDFDDDDSLDELYDEEYDEDYCENDNDDPEQANAPTKPNDTRLDSFDSYIVVSVLTATASFAALLDDNPEGDKSLTQHPMARNIAIFICAICSLSGIYSTVVFSFSSIYGRTALGMGNTDACDAFLKATASMRKKAFYSYLMSLVLFIVLLVIAAVDKIDPQLEIPMVLMLAVLAAFVYRDWGQIIQAAGIIFVPPSTATKKRVHAMKLRSHSLHHKKRWHCIEKEDEPVRLSNCKQL